MYHGKPSVFHLFVSAWSFFRWLVMFVFTLTSLLPIFRRKPSQLLSQVSLSNDFREAEADAACVAELFSGGRLWSTFVEHVAEFAPWRERRDETMEIEGCRCNCNQCNPYVKTEIDDYQSIDYWNRCDCFVQLWGSDGLLGAEIWTVRQKLDVQTPGEFVFSVFVLVFYFCFLSLNSTLCLNIDTSQGFSGIPATWLNLAESG